MCKTEEPTAGKYPILILPKALAPTEKTKSINRIDR
jgi:hypothetical protein